MGTISRQYTFIAGAIPSAANWNADPNNFITLVNGQLDESNVDYSSADGIATLQNTQTITGTKTFSSASGTAFNYGLTINEGSNDSDTRIETNNMANAFVVDAGLDAISFGAAAVDDSFVQVAKGATTSSATQNTYHLSVAPGGATTIPAGTTAYVGSVNIAEPNITATGTVTNAFTVRIAGAPTEGSSTNYALWVDAGATQLDGTLSVGVDSTGADVTFYGDTSGKHLLWDQSEDTLQLLDNTNLTFGTGADADIFYDGTDLNISPAVVGSGDIVVNGASMEFADSEGVTFGTGKDATIQFDATNLVYSTAGIHSFTGANVTLTKATTTAALTVATNSNTASHRAELLLITDADGTPVPAYLSLEDEYSILRMGTGAVGTGGLNFDSNNTMYLNDTANGNMTLGLTLNQGGNDDNIFVAKSSDIAHAFVAHGNETDDWLSFTKMNATQGGATMRVYAEDDTTSQCFELQCAGGTAQTTKTSGGLGLSNVMVFEHDGSNGYANVTANGNVWGVRARVGGGFREVFLIDEDGDYHYDGADGGAYDDYDDLSLVATANSMLRGAVQTGRDWVTTNEDTLVNAGLIGYCSPEEKAKGHDGLWNGSGFQRLFIGTFTQVGDILHRLKEELADTKARLDVAESKLLEA